MISSAKECFWPPCVRIGCHKHRQYIDEVAPALTEKQWDKLESRSQRVDWRETFELDIWPTDGTFSLGSYTHMQRIEAFITKELADARRAVIEEVEGKFHEICQSHSGNPTAIQLAAGVQVLLNNLKEDV